MQEYLSDSVFFGVFLTIFTFQIGAAIQKKWKFPLFNPLLISVFLIIVVLSVFQIPYEVYNKGGQYITSFLTPLTVCLAVPLYRQIQNLKDNIWAILISISCGCLAHAATIIVMCNMLGIDELLRNSLLGKSVTTAIAVGVTTELGGITSIVIIGVTVAGILGAVAGPAVMKLVRVKNPVAAGLGIGCGSHALGTSKVLELGEVQGAMSSLAIVVTGILTVVIVPIIMNFVG